MLPSAHTIVFLLTTLASSAVGSAQQVAVAACTRDNTLYEQAAGSVSNGSGTSVFCGVTYLGEVRRALLHFDVAAAIPPGSRILDARLTLRVTQSIDTAPIPASAHRVARAWGEGASVGSGGGGSGAAAQPNDATWLHTFFPTSTWSSPGGDYDAAPSFAFELPVFGTVTVPTDIHLVQSWLDDPSGNHGWLIRTAELGSSNARRIDSRESLGTKPSLGITYLPPGAIGAWGTGCPVGTGTFGLSYTGAGVGGTTVQIVQNNAPALSIGANFHSLSLDTIGVPLAPSCRVYLPLAQEIVPGDAFVTSTAGAASSPLYLPPGFPNYLIATQSAVLDGSPLGFALSNAAILVLP
jgi:hypothetical protein